MTAIISNNHYYNYAHQLAVSAVAQEQAEKIECLCFPKRDERAFFSPVSFASLGMCTDLSTAARNSYYFGSMIDHGNYALAMPNATYSLALPAFSLGIFSQGRAAARAAQMAFQNIVGGDRIEGIGDTFRAGTSITWAIGAGVMDVTRAIQAANVVTTLSDKIISVTQSLTSIGGALFGLCFAADAVSNGIKLHRLKELSRDVEQNIDDPAVRIKIRKMLGEKLFAELEHAKSKSQRAALIAEVRECLKQQIKITTVDLIFDILSITAAVAGVIFTGGVGNLVAVALTIFTSIYWCCRASAPLLEEIKSHGRYDTAFLLFSTLLFIPTAILSSFTGTNADTWISAALGLSWFAILIGSAMRLKRYEKIDLVQELIRETKKYHFFSAKKLLETFAQEREQRCMIAEIVKERLARGKEWELLARFQFNVIRG